LKTVARHEERLAEAGLFAAVGLWAAVMVFVAGAILIMGVESLGGALDSRSVAWVAWSVAWSVAAVSVATPVALLSAAWVTWFASPAQLGRFDLAIDVIEGVPAVALAALAWWLGSGAPWSAVGSAVVCLAIVVFPRLARAARAGCQEVPVAVLHSAMALGMSRSAAIHRVGLPWVSRSLAAGAVDGCVRAMSDVVVLLVVCEAHPELWSASAALVEEPSALPAMCGVFLLCGIMSWAAVPLRWGSPER